MNKGLNMTTDYASSKDQLSQMFYLFFEKHANQLTQKIVIQKFNNTLFKHLLLDFEASFELETGLTK